MRREVTALPAKCVAMRIPAEYVWTFPALSPTTMSVMLREHTSQRSSCVTADPWHSISSPVSRFKKKFQKKVRKASHRCNEAVICRAKVVHTSNRDNISTLPCWVPTTRCELFCFPTFPICRADATSAGFPSSETAALFQTMLDFIAENLI